MYVLYVVGECVAPMYSVLHSVSGAGEVSASLGHGCCIAFQDTCKTS